MIRTSYIVFAVIILVYFATRLLNLDILPIFNDESTYIRYGIHQVKEPVLQPYSLLIGKEPLLPHLFATFGLMFDNLLIGARMVTVFFGFLTLVGLYLFSKKIIGKVTGIFVSVLYIFSPFNLFFDRLAVLDSAINAIFIWSLFLTISIFDKASWQKGFALGLVVGFGLWIKTSALFFLLLPLISFGIFYFVKNDFIKDKKASGKILTAAFFISLLIFLPLYFHEYYQIHKELLEQYTYPFAFFFSFPLSVWWQNFSNSILWILFYITPIIFIISTSSIAIIRRNSKLMLVLLWFTLPFLYIVFYAKLLTSRHVLFLTIPLLIFASFGLYHIWQKRSTLSYFLVNIVIILSLFYHFFIWFQPEKLPSFFPKIIRNDIGQYVSGFSSGYGVLEAINYLKNISMSSDIIVFIRNDHGNPEDAVVAYFNYDPRIQIVLLSEEKVASDTLKEVVRQTGNDQKIYFVSRGAFYAGLEKYFLSEKKFRKKDGEDFVGVQELSLNF